MEAPPTSQKPAPSPQPPVPRPSPNFRGRIIAFMNQKGGVGKTTTTVNLAAALAQLEHRVLLIDLDPQAHLTLHVGIDPNTLDHSIYDLLVDPDIGFSDVLQTSGGNQLDVIPADVHLAAAETELASHPTRQLILREKIAPLLEHYDYVMIDCPPSLGLLTLNALALANEVIVPMQAQFFALQGLSKLLETVQLVRGQVNPNLTVAGVVLCLHDPQTNLAREVVTDLENFFASSRSTDVPWRNAVVYQPPIRRNIKLAECPSFGQTIFQYEPWCAGGRDYMNLAEAVASKSERPHTNDE
ncbi:MAG: ParA family protein [Phycisphaerales bacterium]